MLFVKVRYSSADLLTFYGVSTSIRYLCNALSTELNRIPNFTRATEVAERVLNNSRFALLLIAAALAGFVWIAFTSEASWGGADATVHYRMARWSWKHPWLLLDMWGKPLLTTLSAPFAYFGFNGMKIFNILVAGLTAWLGFDILKRLGSPLSALVIPLLLFAPVYFIMVPSTMTEPLFALIIITGAWLFLRERHLAAVILLSFLPFSRNEGFIVFPLIILALLLVRKARLIPYILTGHLVYGILGYIHSGDPIWVFRQMPYFPSPERIFEYPAGSLWHYVNRLPDLLGKPLYWSSIAGVMLILAGVLFYRRKPTEENESYLLFFLLVTSPALVYLAAHSWVYWKGTGGAAGLERIMAPLAPMAALTAAMGLSLIAKLRIRWVRPAVMLITASIGIATVLLPFRSYHFPLEFGPDFQTVSRAAGWIRSEMPEHGRIYYFNAYLPHSLGIDPYDETQCWERIPQDHFTEEGFPDKSLIAWDSHFGPNEGQMPLDSIINQPFLKLLYVVPDTVENPDPGSFRVYVFGRR